MPGGTKLITSAVAIATALVLLSACQADPKPIEPTNVSPTATRPTGEPVLPAKGRENNSEGVTTFVAYWVNSLNYASQTGRTERLRQASDKRCSGCFAYIDLIDRVYADGGDYRGGVWTAGEVLVQLGGSASSAFVQIKVDAGVVTISKSASPKREKAFNDQLRFDLKYQTGRFAVTSLTRKPDDA